MNFGNTRMRRPPKLRTGDAQGSKTHSDALWNLEINFLGCCEGLDRLGMHPHAWAFCPASCQDFTLLSEKKHVLQELQIFLKRFIFVVGVSFFLHCSVYRYLFGCRFSPSPVPRPTTPNPGQSQKVFKMAAPPPEMLQTVPTGYLKGILRRATWFSRSSFLFSLWGPEDYLRAF